MIIQTELNQQDFLDFQQYYYKNFSSRIWSQWLFLLPNIIWFGLCCAVCFFAEDFDKKASEIVPFWFGSIIAFVYTIAWWCYSSSESTKKYLAEAKRKGFYDANQVEITVQSITQSNQWRSASVAWKVIEKITVLPEVIYIQINADNPFIIPRRSFESEAQFIEFVAQARNYHTRANP